MKIKAFMKIAICCLSLLSIMMCKETTHNNDKLFESYSERFFQACSPFADEELIISTISYMDSIISKEGNNKIESIFYDKARLLFLLRQYDEALEELFKTDDEYYDIYKATLLICLGRESEAISFLQNAIKLNERGIIELKKQRENIRDAIENYILGLMACYVLADMSYESILYELVSQNIATRQEAEILFQEGFQFISDTQEIKEIILKSTWLTKEHL
jgi:tetratricopeptide (TPR) repeat protein